jgi:RNA polymerase-binding transcription factor DksA
MDTYDTSMTARFGQLLAEREAALRALLPATALADDAPPSEVDDFKDLAQREAQVGIDEVQVEHTLRELEDIALARQRLADHSFGLCRDCGEAIDLRRLLAMPASALCAECQGAHELAGARR